MVNKRAADSNPLERELAAVTTFLDIIAKKHGVSFAEILTSLGKQAEQEVRVPTFIFRERKLGVLETLTKYLKENVHLKYSEIARLLARDDRVIWITYQKAVRKKAAPLTVGEPNEWLPLSIFSERALGTLEIIAQYLRDEKGLRFSEIASLLNRDSRTIWTSYHKSKEKANAKTKKK